MSIPSASPTDPPPEHRELVLASQSPSRRRLLHAAGITPIVRISEVLEPDVAAQLHSAHPSGRVPTGELALALAEAKAADVVRQLCDERPEAVVVAADSLVDVQGVTMGKPSGPADAIKRLTAMSAASIDLITGHCVIDLATGRRSSAVRATRVDFAALSAAEIQAYVASGEPLGVAGCFTLEGYAAPFIEHIEGDPSNVMGLSLPLLRRLLAEVGVSWLQIVDCAAASTP